MSDQHSSDSPTLNQDVQTSILSGVCQIGCVYLDFELGKFRLSCVNLGSSLYNLELTNLTRYWIILCPTQIFLRRH